MLSGLGIEHIVSITTQDALKPYVVQATGPLIRSFAGPSHLIGTDVKIAILSSLSAILVKGAPSCKPFVPQLQTTFVKALQDPSSAVRNKAAGGLAHAKVAVLHIRAQAGLEVLVAVGADDEFLLGPGPHFFQGGLGIEFLCGAVVLAHAGVSGLRGELGKGESGRRKGQRLIRA